MTDGVVRGTGVVVLAGLAVAVTAGVGEPFNIGNGVAVGVVSSSFLIARAEFWLKTIAAMVNDPSKIFIGPC